MYVFIFSNPTSDIAVSSSGSTHLLVVYRIGCIPDIRRATLWWKTPRVLQILGETTQVYAPKKRVTWTIAL